MAKTKSSIKGLKRFLLVLAIVVAYAVYSVYSYGLKQGLSVTLLTWAFFVFGTPIADAGFLVAFPIRLVSGFRMLYTQIIVWVVAAFLVAAYFAADVAVFDKTGILQLFHKIIVTPWPLSLILILSAIGTYVSVVFDDKVFDVAASKNKKQSLRAGSVKLYSTIAIFVATFALYVLLLDITHTHIKIF